MELLERSCPEEVAPDKPTLIVSSYGAAIDGEDAETFDTDSIYPSSDGLIRGAVDAWARHQHLVLRPEEVWFEILAQLNLYMTAHAEDIRHLFVDFEGKQEISVERSTWQNVLRAFSHEIQKRVKTEWLEEWIKPGFTTSTDNDNITSTVLMMGLMKQYFEFSGGIICGLPSVTLAGEKKDWVKLLEKLDRLKEFGIEPTVYAHKLRPLLTRFVQTWDDPESDLIRNFWRQIVRAEENLLCDAGPTGYAITGWITAFLHWEENGVLRRPREMNAYLGREDEMSVEEAWSYPVPLEDMPVGYAKVPFKMLNYPEHGKTTHAFLLAGNIGVRRDVVNRESGGDDGQMEDIVVAQPLSAWFMYAPASANATTETWPFGSEAELMKVAQGLRQCQD